MDKDIYAFAMQQVASIPILQFQKNIVNTHK